MITYALRRILSSLPSLLIIMITLFLISRYQDIDPVERELAFQYEEGRGSQYTEAYSDLYTQKGLDKPLFYCTIVPYYYPDNIHALTSPSERKELKSKLSSPEYINTLPWYHKLPTIHWHGMDNQFQHWMASYAQGTMGHSYIDGRPVESKISAALVWTIMLMGISLFISIIIAIPLGVYLALKPNGMWQKITQNALFLLYAIPVFWMATLMIIFFTTPEYGRWTHIFPTVGLWETYGKSTLAQVIGNFDLMILPIFILCLGNVVYMANLVKNALLEERSKPYFLTLQAKGLGRLSIFISHLLPNAMLPLITLLAGAIPGSLAGSLIIEVIFNIPGVGRLLYESITKADWNVVYPIVLLIAILTIVFLALADILLYFLFPKTRLKT